VTSVRRPENTCAPWWRPVWITIAQQRSAGATGRRPRIEIETETETETETVAKSEPVSPGTLLTRWHRDCAN
jgi:hypothetical protein